MMELSTGTFVKSPISNAKDPVWPANRITSDRTAVSVVFKIESPNG
jgi:hypothetical protein